MLLLLLIALGAFCSTFAGGLFAIRLEDKLHLILGFSAGAVLAVALADLLPEALEMGQPSHSPATLVGWLMLSFLLYLVLDRVNLLHRGTATGPQLHHGQRTDRAMLGAGSLSAHSFLDGVAIGMAFQASAAVGAIVTLAVLTHDFSDGINTVNVVMKNGGTKRLALQWLVMDAVAPAAGVAATLFVTVGRASLGVTLAVFAGFFLYIGASDLIPESYHVHPKMFTTAMTVLGAAVIYAAVRLAGG
jgi:ZIP family zinc transporter